VDERFLDQLRTGQPASVVADAYTDQRFAARVISIAPSVDAQRGSVEVKLALTGDAPDYLREDMTLSVEVETGRRESALVLPLAALRTAADAEQAEVMVVDAGRARLRVVRLGLRTLAAVEVVDGLTSGEQVLLGTAVQVGQRVRPQARAPGVTAGAGASDAGAALSNAMGR
jgi:HlyD family secretion protein